MIQIGKKLINVLVDGSSKCGKSQLISKLSDHYLHEGIEEYERYQKRCIELIINDDLVTIMFYENTNQKYVRDENEYNIQFHVYLLLFDIADQQSFQSSVSLYNQYSQKFASSIKFLIANKSDLSIISNIIQKVLNNFPYNSQKAQSDIQEFLYESNKWYLTDVVEQFVQQNGFIFYPVSSSTKKNIQTIREQIIKIALNTSHFKAIFITLSSKLAFSNKSKIQKQKLVKDIIK